jgi:hypothetical protein
MKLEGEKMPKGSFERIETDRHPQSNPLVSYLASFATSLVDNGYVESTVQSKLNCWRVLASGWSEDDCRSQISTSRSLRGSSLTSGERAESTGGIEKHFGSFWIIFERVT